MLKTFGVVVFWLLWLMLAIEDALFYEVNLFLTSVLILFFGFFYSVWLTIACIVFFIVFKNLKSIGEADLFFIPFGFFICHGAYSFFLYLIFWALLLMDNQKKRTAMTFPVILSVIFSSLSTDAHLF